MKDYNQSEQNMIINNFNSPPNISYDDNIEKISLSYYNNILESQEIEEKFTHPFIYKLGCNHLHRDYEQSRHILESPPQDNIYKKNIVDNSNFLFEEDEDINNYDLYYTTNSKTNTYPKILFDVKRKRCRVTKKENIDINNLGRKFDEDNIISKIKNSYTNCTIDLFNQILKSKKVEKIKFYPLSHDISKKSNKKEINEMKIASIEEFISKDVSAKYYKKNKKINIEVCSIIKNDENLKDIAYLLKLNCLFFFDKIYYQKRKETYRLSDYDLTNFIDIEFKIPKEMELYEDLLEKNKNEPFYEKYKTEMEKYCKLNFIPNQKTPNFKVKKFKGKKIKK